ncbi:hypothetical protein G6F44_004119 [Rhizopus delemar]|nr:hypothetical protein G6F44_004119 [Rhizopus delemar]
MWEDLKVTVQRITKHSSRNQAFTLAQGQKLIQKKRSGLLTIVESQLAEIQQCHVDTLALLVGIHWREKRELSPGYLARVVASRATRQLALPLKHPTSSSICYTKDNMIDTTSTFYSALYTPHPVDQVAIDDLLRSLPEDLHITETEQNHLTRPIKYDKLLEGVLRCPSRSSPGTDGFTYKLLSVIFQLPVCREILLDVYNTALNDGVFSVSWQGTCISLLPKKGDLSHLKNWRPISLINTDAKIFTRIPNARMMQFTNKLITPFQTGFVRDRFIADNCLLMKLTMYHTRNTGSQSIGLMLDQEKAYDRVHPEYLKQSINSFLRYSTAYQHERFPSSSISQLRGLRQGDPISPILFNLAFESLLRRIISDPTFRDFSLPRSSFSHPSDLNLQQIKLLTYTDDMVCLLRSPSDLHDLQTHLAAYSRAFNAKINFHKALAISLLGALLSNSELWRSPLLENHVTHWHGCSATLPACYLVFPLPAFTAQRVDIY